VWFQTPWRKPPDRFTSNSTFWIAGPGVNTNSGRVALTGAVKVSLEHQRVFRRKHAIAAKAPAKHPPAICSVRACETGKLTLVEIFRVHAIVRALACSAAILDGSKSLFNIPVTCNQQPALGFGSFSADDVDDTVYGVRSPDRTARAADDFDSLDVTKGRSKTSQKTPPNVGVYTVRPSISTNSSLLNRALNPRTLTAHVLALIRATSSPGTILSRSGILVAPERRMASGVITKTADAACESFCSVFETDVT
jgi:hypothetical protein